MRRGGTPLPEGLGEQNGYYNVETGEHYCRSCYQGLSTGDRVFCYPLLLPAKGKRCDECHGSLREVDVR